MKLAVVGLGQAMIDLSAAVDDDALARLGAEKGSRRVIDVAERGAVLTALGDGGYTLSAGGSLSNTLAGLARLGTAAPGAAGRPLRIAMAGLIGDDALGAFYAAQLRAAGVAVVSPRAPGAATGTVAVLTSPDAQRTMLSYLGTPAPVALPPRVRAAIAGAEMLVIEGYVWELPGAAATVADAVAAARAAGTAVALTAGDAGVVARHGAEIWAVLEGGVDVLFTNAEEAAALAARRPGAPGAPPLGAEAAALALGPHAALVCVTNGSAGSALAALGELHVIPPYWLTAEPVCTCGAGDAFAAGLLFAYLRRLDVPSMGRAAARVASAVLGRRGAALGAEAAAALARALPAAAAPRTGAAPAPVEASSAAA
jgi:sugar/nucleoside kinase (ribokinase family)